MGPQMESDGRGDGERKPACPVGRFPKEEILKPMGFKETRSGESDSAASKWGHMEIVEYHTPLAGDLPAINDLLRELNAGASELTMERLKKICAAPQMHLFIAYDAENIIGMATLEIGETMMGTQGYVHDIVVSSVYRGKGLGKMLMEKVIMEARKLAVRHVDLTSNPKRNTEKFYLSLGFVKRETDCYRKEL